MRYLKKFNEDAYGDGHIAAYNGYTLKDNPYKKGTEDYKDWKMGWEDDTEEDPSFQEIRKIHKKYNKKNKTNEEFTSATGGNAGALTGGEVYSMPNSMTTSIGPNSIGSNIGGTNMNNTDIEEDEEDNIEEIDEVEEEESEEKKKKDKIRKKIEEQEEKEAELEEQPVMNWDNFVKQNINKINI